MDTTCNSRLCFFAKRPVRKLEPLAEVGSREAVRRCDSPGDRRYWSALRADKLPGPVRRVWLSRLKLRKAMGTMTTPRLLRHTRRRSLGSAGLLQDSRGIVRARSLGSKREKSYREQSNGGCIGRQRVMLNAAGRRRGERGYCERDNQTIALNSFMTEYSEKFTNW
jgi:hypothetical protein